MNNIKFDKIFLDKILSGEKQSTIRKNRLKLCKYFVSSFSEKRDLVIKLYSIQPIFFSNKMCRILGVYNNCWMGEVNLLNLSLIEGFSSKEEMLEYPYFKKEIDEYSFFAGYYYQFKLINQK